ncbi:echinoderm microtubule-associated protein-like elp-1 [Anaeramoeba flamelloides]|uniref:Echinoderm microtubule-associated protein-like elp-1 n=1 Tax=Anaeramoeba flamelloides TaxID=1746091 RepID=A0AAV7YWM2_9EUKA|nr:echinoderm microtubule-associated protein-like elp-1 [Anaeramoeba flamelloides]
MNNQNQTKYTKWIHLTIVEARGFKEKQVPSTFCVAMVDSQQKYKSVLESKTYSPYWDQDFKFAITSPQSTLSIYVFNANPQSPYILIGKVEIPISDIINSGKIEDWFQLSQVQQILKSEHERKMNLKKQRQVNNFNKINPEQTTRNYSNDNSTGLLSGFHKTKNSNYLQNVLKTLEIPLNQDMKDRGGDIKPLDIQTLKLHKTYSTPQKVPNNNRSFPKSHLKSHTLETPQLSRLNKINSFNSKLNTNNSNGEDFQFEIEHIYGFNSTKRDSLFYNYQSHLVFFAASVAIIMDPETGKQRFFRKHTKPIDTIAIHKDKRIIATSQIEDTKIYVWDCETLQVLSILDAPHPDGFNSISFSFVGKKIITIGSDRKQTVCLWDWGDSKLINSTIGPEKKTLMVSFHPQNSNSFISCGINNMLFWKFTESAMVYQEGQFSGKGDKILLSLLITNDSQIFTGTRQGFIYKWDPNSCSIEKIFRSHKQSTNSLATDKSNCLFSCGKDGNIACWDSTDFTKNYIIPSIQGGPIISIDYMDGHIAVGTSKNQIWTTNIENKSSEKILIPHWGDVYGVTCHPTLPQFITMSFDRSVILWSMETKQQIKKLNINGQPKMAIYSPNGKYVAIGLHAGAFAVASGNDLQLITNKKVITQEISYMFFSPNLKYLGVSYMDGSIFIFNILTKYKKTIKFNLPGVNTLDFSSDDNCFKASSNIETVCWDIEKHAKIQENSVSWATNNSQYSKFSKNLLQTQILNNYIISGEENSNNIKFKNIFSLEEEPILIPGHGSNITSVKIWKNYMFSVGCKDQCIFQWKKK